MHIVDAVFSEPDESAQATGLVGYVNVTVGGDLGRLAIHDIRLLVRSNGEMFISMPSRKLTFRCENCKVKNVLSAQYCNECGLRVKAPPVQYDRSGREKDQVDIIHPIDQVTRIAFTKEIIRRYEAGKTRNSG